MAKAISPDDQRRIRVNKTGPAADEIGTTASGTGVNGILASGRYQSVTVE